MNSKSISFFSSGITPSITSRLCNVVCVPVQPTTILLPSFWLRCLKCPCIVSTTVGIRKTEELYCRAYSHKKLFPAAILYDHLMIYFIFQVALSHFLLQDI